MKDLDLTSLRYFVAVCETGNISRAAQQEHVVPSAISKRLAHLEDDLQVPLFVRQRRGVVPTPAGESLLEHSRAILSSANRIAQDMASFGAGLRGQVRLLGTVSAIAESLPDDVAGFMQMPEHHEIQVDIEEELSRDIVRRIREGSASLGVLWDASKLDGLQSAPYRADHLAVVVHPHHPLASRRRCRFEDTLDHQHVGLQASSAVNRMLERAAAVAGKRMAYRSTVSNFEAALRVVQANLGISIIPKEVAGANAERLGLKVLPLTDAWAKRRFVICFRDRDKLTRAAAMLLDYLSRVARA
ncbi:LysR family transcriptional regulator [Ramlibacter rhizophilus]|uniref:LysR family transcriptional regulator n=1 Tax=Ramlibacter rhizophilus TaxID=1781167 RepID=A0A4Z0BNH6_9BURK|nr:LysR family transcriptional regulator [Ramlibacter rhizophilus]TFY99807.1 LysR family transcriptional regulator [Ramlibacter rhizophilus]